jgi:orotate phosphoribosyltransferase
MLAARSSKRGEFRLASGRTSDFYVDARLTTMSAGGLALVGQVGLSRIRDAFPRARTVGGLTLGADPIAYAIALTSAGAPPELQAFTVRKEAKGHGTGRLVEGPIQPGDVAVVVEDVVTSGGSALRAIAALRGFGAEVAGVLALVDRQEGGKEAIEATGIPVIALVGRADIMRLI